MPKFPSLPQGCPVTLTLIAINILLYLAQLGSQDLVTNLGLMYGPAIQAGDWWRLFSAAFLHGSLLHIGFNMFLLYSLGPILEKPFGSSRFALIYIGGLAGSALAVMLFDWRQPTLGASGAVLGLAGAMGVALYERGIKPQQSPIFGLVVINLGLPLLVPGISFWGHFGGVLTGAAMAYLVIWRPMRSRDTAAARSLSMPSAAVVLLAAMALAVAIMGGLPI